MTIIGRYVAAALMISGIALLGVVTAMIASWLVERVGEAVEAEETATRAQVDALRTEVAELRAILLSNDRTARGDTEDVGTIDPGSQGR